jgi:hypothetical protein
MDASSSIGFSLRPRELRGPGTPRQTERTQKASSGILGDDEPGVYGCAAQFDERKTPCAVLRSIQLFDFTEKVMFASFRTGPLPIPPQYLWERYFRYLYPRLPRTLAYVEGSLRKYLGRSRQFTR